MSVIFNTKLYIFYLILLRKSTCDISHNSKQHNRQTVIQYYTIIPNITQCDNFTRKYPPSNDNLLYMANFRFIHFK